MPNERLRSSIAAAGLSMAGLAERVDADPKTVERWVSSGRLPLARYRRLAARVLSRDEYYLWPAAATQRLRSDPSSDELVQLFPSRSAVSQDLWSSLLATARHNIDVLAYSALFLTDGGADLPRRLLDRASDGALVRLALGDPTSDAVRVRGQDEGIGDGLTGRVRLQLSYLGCLADSPGVELRQHGTTLYNSIFRFDEEMLVNCHTFGAPAAQSPVLHLHRLEPGKLFDHYLASFDRVWDAAAPAALASGG